MKRYLVILCSIFCLCFFTVSFAADSHNYKKVVSIVYDDSGSMLNLNNYCYSDYALQILTASLGQSDELNIVKVSTPNLNNEIDLSTSSKKQNYIDTIRKFQHNGGTYFESVDTAKNWLISKKAIYGDSADYWFVVITDGEFAGMPNDLNSYFSNLNQEFNNMNYEFVLLNIGESFDQKLENAVKNSANSSVVKAKDRDSIYNSILSISNMINRGASDKIIKVTPVNSTKINVQVDLPLEKMMLLMQNTQGKVKSVKNISTGKSLSFENYDVRYESVASLNAAIVQIMDNNVGSISRGSYEIEFDSNVDINNISFLCEAFVSAKITIVDDNDKVLNDSQLKFLTSNKRIRVRCELLDGNGTTKIELSNTGVDFSNIKVQLVNDKNKYNMTYDTNKKAYYADLTLIGKNNNIYAIAEATDVFRIKSNVIFVDTVANQMNVDQYDGEKVVFEVPYSSKKEYQEVANFSFSFKNTIDEYNTAEEFELKLINLPKGVHIEYEGKEYDDNDSIPMLREIGKDYQLKVLANRDYKENADVVSILKIVTKEEGADIYWDDNGTDELNIVFRPKLFRLDIVRKNTDASIDVNKDTINLSVIRINEELNTVVGNVDVNDVNKIETNSKFGTGYTYKVKKNEKSNLLEVEFKPNVLAIFKSNKVPVEITIELSNGKEYATYSEEIELLNIDVWALIRPFVIALILLIILIGYLTKKKFNKKSQIAITENGERLLYSLRPQMKTVLIPYIAHKAKVGMIEFTASKNNELTYSAKGLDIVKLDGEDYEEYKENNRINLEKMVMKRDFSSIIINAFEVEQKYEYITKEPEGGSFVDDADGDFSSSDSYTDSYTDDYQF